MQRVNNDDHSDHAEKDRNDGVFVYLFRQHQISEQNGKDGIAAEQNRYHRSLRVQNTKLEQNHADNDADKPGKSKEGKIRPFQLQFFLFFLLCGQRQQNQPADEKTKKGQLNRVQRSGGQLQCNFHGAEQNGCQKNVKIPLFQAEKPRI